ncbi:aldo/keto reductase, partial [Enterobacteriaceae bacterium 8376wG6]|nr:aldo/keto reductase [Enterobacteriaceae bacterium 8376wG6]
NTANELPQLGLGVWKAGNDEVVSAIHKALEVGYRSIDTAAAYKNEDGVGKALASAGVPRDELFITTKLWNDDQGDPLAALETSLEKLKLDYVDLYLIHWPRPQQDQYVSAWRELIKLREQGLVKSIGVCNFHTP